MKRQVGRREQDKRRRREVKEMKRQVGRREQDKRRRVEKKVKPSIRNTKNVFYEYSIYGVVR